MVIDGGLAQTCQVHEGPTGSSGNCYTLINNIHYVTLTFDLDTDMHNEKLHNFLLHLSMTKHLNIKVSGGNMIKIHAATHIYYMCMRELTKTITLNEYKKFMKNIFIN